MHQRLFNKMRIGNRGQLRGSVRGIGRGVGMLTALAGVFALGGCIERRIQVTSEPPGATVWLNDVEIGTTPTEAEFRYFGTYDVRLRKAGFEPIATKKKADAPFYEFPGPDLVAEALPGTNETVIRWHFKLEPALESQGDPRTAEDALIQRAREMGSMVPRPDVKEGEGKPAAEAKPAPEAKSAEEAKPASEAAPATDKK